MKNKLVKIILGVIGTILIGAIGSGVWERFLSPLIDSTASRLASLFSLVSKSYANSLYSDIGKGNLGTIGHFVMIPYMLVLTIMFLYPFSLIFSMSKKLRKLKSATEEQSPDDSKSDSHLKNKQLDFSEKFKKVRPFLYFNYIIVFPFR